MSEQLPPLPHHPDCHAMTWSESEKRSIKAYGEECARAAIEARAAVPAGWQTIETAPKDGTVILLFGCDRVTAGHWEHERWPTSAEYHGTTGEYLGQFETGECIEAWWYSEDGGFAKEHPPTHWMPLPAAPGAGAPQPVAQPSEAAACLIRSRSYTPARACHDGKTHYGEWGRWEPATLAHGTAVTDPSRNTDPKLWEMKLLYTAQAKPEQAAQPEAEALCPKCNGSGEMIVLSDNGPDAHEMTVCCDHCNGAGTLDAAYEGVLTLLRRMTTAWHKALPYQVAHQKMQPMPERQKERLAGNYFAEDWSKSKAMSVIEEVERHHGITLGENKC